MRVEKREIGQKQHDVGDKGDKERLERAEGEHLRSREHTKPRQTTKQAVR